MRDKSFALDVEDENAQTA